MKHSMKSFRKEDENDGEKTAILDLTGCKSIGEMHRRIQKALDFPEHYGAN